jgi:Zn-finger nucleic acid-binding protein
METAMELAWPTRKNQPAGVKPLYLILTHLPAFCQCAGRGDRNCGGNTLITLTNLTIISLTNRILLERGPTGMLCPVCNVAMVIVEHQNIELDYCTRCKGVWFDSGELELLLESANLGNFGEFLGNIMNKREATTTEKKRKCPICTRKMKKVLIDDEKILVDICRHRHGIWFDNQEVQRLVKSLAEKSTVKPDSRQNVMDFLGEVFKY